MNAENNCIDFKCAMDSKESLYVEVVDGNNLEFITYDRSNYATGIHLSAEDAKKLRDFLNEKLG